MATTTASRHTSPRTPPQKARRTSPAAAQPSTSVPSVKMTVSVDYIKQTARLAAERIERTITPVFPRRFRHIDDAKEYVKELCHRADFDFFLPSRHNLQAGIIHPIVQAVESRAAFLVAIHAYNDKEFYLDEDMHDPSKLRGAVEANVERALSVIKIWPTGFEGAEAASQWVQRVCSQRGVTFTRFDGVLRGKFLGYIGWNTVRKAWEENQVQLKNVPKEWARTVSTMNDAIETDITRLLQLITTWPATFSHLNSARNFVQQWCYTHHFRYTGWEKVAAHRFGLFVNFATAERALAGGLFKLTGTKPSHALPRPVVARAGAEEEERADSPSPPSSVSVGSDDSTAPSLSKSAASDNTLIDLEEEAEPVEQSKACVDPFKHLYMGMKMGSFDKPVSEPEVVEEAGSEPVDILKMAFE